MRSAALAFAAILALPGVLAPAPQPSPGDRSFEEGLLVSRQRPALEYRAPAGFDYLGRSEIPLHGVALAERHHFAAVRDGRVERLVVLQFEHYLDGIDGTYRFGIPDHRAGSSYRFSPQRIELGGFSFVHNTWAFDNAAGARENPDAEAAATLRLLAENGVRLDDALLMSRYVTAVGDDRRAELILFYMEPLAAHGLDLATLGDTEVPRDDFDAASARVTQTSRAVFANLVRR